MQVLYKSADEVRLAAAQSLGFGRGIPSRENSPASRDDGTGALIAKPARPNAAAVKAAENELESIMAVIRAEEAVRGG